MQPASEFNCACCCRNLDCGRTTHTFGKPLILQDAAMETIVYITASHGNHNVRFRQLTG